ncbi:carbohydrate kinase family protein [Jannaschia sp. 2305UL9-9]|uniref:carbohydrate kinase family protein n=1 Tax=Jannaschia sp. 2305UL9-9 TaxID=3121638 RepID=UPI003529A94E
MADASTPPMVCLGNMTIDDVVLPDGTRRPGCIGGDALYAALAARPWCPGVEIVAPVGDDVPAAILDGLTRAGFSAEGLPVRPGKTLHNQVVYDAEGGRVWTLYNDPADFDSQSPMAADLPQHYRSPRRALISAMALASQEDLVDHFTRTGETFVALDPQEDYIKGNEDRLRSMIAKVDAFLPSEDEVTQLTGLTDWAKAARLFAALGPRIVVIKRGAAGVLLHDAENDTDYHVPPAPGAAVVDTTGAGDSFCGAFTAALDVHPPQIAAMAGAVAASFTVAGYGATPLLSAPTSDISQRFEDWRARMTFRQGADGFHLVGGAA